MTKRRRTRTSEPKAVPSDVESAMDALGLEILGGDDNEVRARCPKHEERTGKPDRHPSFSVNRTSGLFGCWSCSYTGTFHRLVMDMAFPRDAWAAAKWIRRRGIDLEQVTDALRFTPVEPEPERPSLDLMVRYQMFDPCPPEEALAGRRISAEAAVHYGIRWDPKKDAWILPMHRDGVLVGWQIKSARFFHNTAAKGSALFGLEVFPEGEPAVLMESPLDVARLHTAGYTGGLATFGSAFSDDQIRNLVAVTDTVILAFDDDAPGRKATQQFLFGEKGRLAWSRKLHVELLEYGDTGAKDLGDMDDTQIADAVANRKYWLQQAVRNELRAPLSRGR